MNKNNSRNLTINNVTYAPQLRYNLLSVTVLMEKGCIIVSEINCVLIFDIYNSL